MNNIKEFNEHPLSRLDFWRITGPVCAGITLLALVIISWERLRLAYVKNKLDSFREKRRRDIEAQWRRIEALGEFGLHGHSKRQEPTPQRIQRAQHWEHHNESNRQTPSILQSQQWICRDWGIPEPGEGDILFFFNADFCLSSRYPLMRWGDHLQGSILCVLFMLTGILARIPI